MGCTVHEDTSIRHKWVQVRLGGGGGYPADVDGGKTWVALYTKNTPASGKSLCVGRGGCYPVDVDGGKTWVALYTKNTPASGKSLCVGGGGGGEGGVTQWM